jgi:ribokinase
MIIVLNPSPMNESVLAMPLQTVDWFLLNEEEANALAGVKENAAAVLAQKYPHASLVITLGAKGSLCLKDGTETFQEAFPVKAVDTVGAGDTFTGYLIGLLAGGKDLETAMRFASKASSISVTRKGASTSVPSIDEVADALHE